MRLSIAAVLSTLALPATASAAGYDTPMLYSARHMGMAGTAISYVADPSAAFHNPAGFSRIEGGALMLDVSPLRGTIKASPNAHTEARSIDSVPAIAPLFLAGGGYRVWDNLVAGLSIFPVGSAAGGYEYPYEFDKTKTTKDSATLAFIEVAPTLAYKLPMGFRIGATWRYTIGSFARKRDQEILGIDLDMKGTNTKGFRAGLQWSGGDFDVGLVYRNKLDLDVKAASGNMLLPAENINFQFIFPSKLGLGVQYRGIANLRLAADFEYAFNSENQQTSITGTVKGSTPPKEEKLINYYEWVDGETIRLGGAYTIGRAEARVGYAHDAQVTQKNFPSAFGTPPAATTIFTAGMGYQVAPSLSVAVAGAYRTGKATVEKGDLDPKCVFCGKEGDYALDLFGAYFDVVWQFGGPPAEPAPSAEPASGAESTPAAPPPP